MVYPKRGIGALAQLRNRVGVADIILGNLPAGMIHIGRQVECLARFMKDNAYPPQIVYVPSDFRRCKF